MAASEESGGLSDRPVRPGRPATRDLRRLHDAESLKVGTLANQVGAAHRAASLLERLEHAQALGRRLDPPEAG